MRVAKVWKLSLVFVTLVTVACGGGAAPTGGQRTGDTGVAAQPGTPKRFTAAIQGDPHTLAQKLNPASRVRGIDALEQMVSAGLTIPDRTGKITAQLAEAVPSTDNGQWVVLPDGRMTTTWKIREGAKWHDGQPVTSSDMAFTLQVVRDEALPVFNEIAYDWIEGVDTPDSRTVTVRWKQPFIEADTLFSVIRAMPMPRHLLERAYESDKATFIDQPHWSTEFIGNGPFKLKDWQRGSHLVFEAFDGYVLGRPKIDIVEVRFIIDDNALGAAILSGTVELTLGRTNSGEQALTIAEQWRDGRIDIAYENWIAFYPQLLTPNPAVVGDVRFRKALMHGSDRQQLVDVLQHGRTSVADSYLNPGQPEYKELEERMVVRYPFDPRRAIELIDSTGLVRGPDGYRDASGQRISLEMRTTEGDDLREKTLLSIQNDWQRLGLGTEPVIIPRQRAADLEYRATYPAVELVRQPIDVRGMRGLHSRYTPLPENAFRSTGNRSRYQNPEFDAMLDKFFTTIPRGERTQVLGQILHHMSENVVIMGMFYNTSPTLLSNRLVNVGAGGEGTTQAWNAHLWDLK